MTFNSLGVLRLRHILGESTALHQMVKQGKGFLAWTTQARLAGQKLLAPTLELIVCQLFHWYV